MCELLYAIEAYVGRDDLPPGFDGIVCIGVRQGAYDTWLNIHIGVGMEMADAPLPHADVFLLLGDAEAYSVLSGDPLDEEADLILAGDFALLCRFLDRYLHRKDVVGLRVAIAAGAF